MYQVTDLRHLKWGSKRQGGASYGCYMKSSEVKNGIKVYYKLSNYNSAQGFIGEESIYEVIVSRFLRILGFNCVKYNLIRARVLIHGAEYETYACKSEDFARGYTDRTSFENLREMYMQESVESLITRFGFASDIRRIILADFMVIGRDRHGANIELLQKNGKYFVAPIFDNGLSLLCTIPVCLPDSSSRVSAFDSMADYRVNNYIGTQSLYQNLSYVTVPVRVNKLTQEDKRRIFYNMSEVLPKYYIDKCWEISSYRYNYLRQRGYIINA